MAYTHEELRAGAFEVLSGRFNSSWGKEQYPNFKIAVSEALHQKNGTVPQRTGMFAADAAFDKADAESFREVFWDLFRDGIITLGSNETNPQFPFFRLSRVGRKIMEEQDFYFFQDLSEFEKRVIHEVPDISEITLLYLKEALQAFRSGCILSSSVMLGVAAEFVFNQLIDAFENNKSTEILAKTVTKERQILSRINKFKACVESHRQHFPKSLLEDFDTNFLAIQSIIRNFRNESGHPTGNKILREQAFINLQLVIPFFKKSHEFISHLKTP